MKMDDLSTFSLNCEIKSTTNESISMSKIAGITNYYSLNNFFQASNCTGFS